MSEYFVVVMDKSQARFFALKPVAYPELESGPILTEEGELPGRNKKSAERYLFADSKTGRGRAPRGGPSHGYDDHRTRHQEESGRRFGREVLERIKRFARKNNSRVVVLAAPEKTLGMLREDMNILTKEGLTVEKLAKDMTKFSAKDIHEYMAKKGLLPPRKKPGT